MRLKTGDPRLIDFALGELPQEEAEAIESALALPENDAARRLVEETRQLADLSTLALASEPAETLDDARRATVQLAAERRDVPKKAVWRWRPALGMAASLAVGIGLIWWAAEGLRAPQKDAFRTAKLEQAPQAPRQEVELEVLREQLEGLGYVGGDVSVPEAKATPDGAASSPMLMEQTGAPEPNKPTSAGQAVFETPEQDFFDSFEELPISSMSNQQIIGSDDGMVLYEPPAPVRPDTGQVVEEAAVGVLEKELQPTTFDTQPEESPVMNFYSAVEVNPPSNGEAPTDSTSVARGLGEAPMSGGYGGAGGAFGGSGGGGLGGGGGSFGNSEVVDFGDVVPSDGLDSAWSSEMRRTAAPNAATPSADEFGEFGVSMGSPVTREEERTAGVSFDTFQLYGKQFAGKETSGTDWYYGYPAEEMPISEPSDRRFRTKWPRGGERYAPIVENTFQSVERQPLSTFSLDVDTGAYSNVRRFIQDGMLPPPDAVRIEELINYFDYHYAPPEGVHPFAVHAEVGACPWQPEHYLARIGVKGREVHREDRPVGNFVFLLDVSGSMSDAKKLPLVKEAMKALLEELQPQDRVGIVTYASQAGVHLPSMVCGEKEGIRASIDALHAGGSTNGSGGIQQAYAMAAEHFVAGGINRVILATDGDFNVGMTDLDDLLRLIQDKARGNVFLTTLGFGMGNLKDETLERLADAGNGNYAYIDSFTEARRVLVKELTGTLITIAKDVKVQVEFNPAAVGAYRLIGYENRALAARDFNDDTKDAGEIGGGHTVTALYEIVPTGHVPQRGVDPLRYQPREVSEPVTPANAVEWMNIKLRYKQPEGTESSKLEVPVPRAINETVSGDFRFAASVAAFGMLLRDSEYAGGATYDMVVDLANGSKGNDPERQAFVDLAVTAKTISAVRRAQ